MCIDYVPVPWRFFEKKIEIFFFLHSKIKTGFELQRFGVQDVSVVLFVCFFLLLFFVVVVFFFFFFFPPGTIRTNGNLLLGRFTRDDWHKW